MLQVIANKTAGNGAGASALEKVAGVLNERGLAYEIHLTEGKDHACVLADQALRAGNDEIVCLGGDGTFSEVVKGLDGRFATLFLIPCGTGNDFVRMLKLPSDPAEALSAQLDGTPRKIDLGMVNDTCFLNVSGAGFDVEVLRQAEHFKRFGKGILPYLMGIFASLKKFRPLEAEFVLEDGQRESRKVTIFSVGNGSFIGGGMKAVPNARIDDGLFDVVVADEMSRALIVILLAKFIKGRHIELAAVREWRCRELTVRCPGMVVEIDGELAAMDCAHYRLLPEALGLCLPADN